MWVMLWFLSMAPVSPAKKSQTYIKKKVFYDPYINLLC